MIKKHTIVYIDGFNLYYGSLKEPPYKWLNLMALFNHLLDEYHTITEIKYFTAHISARGENDKSANHQKIYLKALSAHIPELKIYYGHYLTNKVLAKVCVLPPEYIRVFKTEEKGSDVNLALHILNDALCNQYDCAVLVSNDSDIAEALRFAKEEHHKMIGFVVPGDDKARKTSQELAKYAEFKHRISKQLLANSQLPDWIPGTNFYKPTNW
jgi:Protein of unknown function DUF88.